MYYFLLMKNNIYKNDPDHVNMTILNGVLIMCVCVFVWFVVYFVVVLKKK